MINDDLRSIKIQLFDVPSDVKRAYNKVADYLGGLPNMKLTGLI